MAQWRNNQKNINYIYLSMFENVKARNFKVGQP